MLKSVPLGAFVGTAATMVLMGGLLGAPAQAATHSEDEDAFVQVAPAHGQPSGWGTGWANQVVSTRHGRQVGNVMTGWLSFYGMTHKARYSLQVVKGRCGSEGQPVSASRSVRTDRYGGWHGKYHVHIRTGTTWVVRGGFRVDVHARSGATVACGQLRDDPDVGN